MEQVTAVALTQQNTDPNASLTLEQAADRIRTLLSHGESTGWELGDLLNSIEKRSLARNEGFGKTRKWLETKVPEAAGKISLLYRYANVASHYTKEHVQIWGMNKLQWLAAHDRELGDAAAGDPGERELQLLQKDGSTLAKKFRDCTHRELQLSNQLRKKTAKGPAQAVTAAPESEVHSIRKSLAALGVGIGVTSISGFLPSSFLTTWVFLLGAGLFLSGIAMLIRHWEIARDRLLNAFKEDRTIELLSEQVAKARRGTLKLTAVIRSRVSRKPVITASKETTPPAEKKAA